MSALVEIRKPERLNALTGLRCFAAINIVLFHFSNPLWFGVLAPIVDAGYISVSYFILLSGFVLAYNYSNRARNGQLEVKRFFKSRFARLYPIYLLSLVLSWRSLPIEYSSHTPFLFWMGIVLSPLLLQGWVWQISTFLNTPAWTMSAEAFYYAIFPWMARWRRPAKLGYYFVQLGLVWFAGMLPGILYYFLNPDGLVSPDRWSTAPWLRFLKYTPLPHLPGFIFGVLLADLDELIDRRAPWRLWLGLGGFAAIAAIFEMGLHIPYVLIHDGLIMPLFGCVILGLAGDNWLARALGWRPLVFVGQASFCLYLLHFNFWNLIHDSRILNLLHLNQFDPWISYVALVGLALLGFHFVEKPSQRLLKRWLGA